ncbi:MAG: MFS transporter [Blastocatellia bacterium]
MTNTRGTRGWGKWSVVLLLFLATLLNYMDRQTIAISASVISKEFGLGDAQLGQLFFAFLFAYGIAQLFAGALLDRFPVRLAYAAAVIAWSLAGASGALATGFVSLFALRVLLGVCESPNWPLALRVVARTIPPEQRSLANGIFQSGTSIGALVAAPVIIWLTAAYSWRAAFVAVGAVGLLWAALWLVSFRGEEDVRHTDVRSTGFSRNDLNAEPLPPEGGTTNLPASFGEIIRSRAFLGLFIAASFLNPLQYFYVTWLPRYFDKYAGMGFGKELAQRLVTVYLALDLGLWLGGALVLLLARRVSVTRARQMVTALGAVLMAGIPLAGWLRDLNAITALICLATFGLGCFMVNYLAFTSEVSDKKVSTAAGLLGGAGSLAGALFMLLVGGTVESSGSFALAFVMAGVMPLVALGGVFIATRTGAAPIPAFVA